MPYLQGSHADHLVGVIEEIGQDVKNGGFRENKFLCQRKKTNITFDIEAAPRKDDESYTSQHNEADLQVLWTELVAVHVNG